MNAYIYQAALICEPCGDKIKADLNALRVAFLTFATPERVWLYDSNTVPYGPFPDCGGEADSPQHCDSCGVFLENPLTEDGREYVANNLRNGGGDPAVLREWSAFYKMPYTDYSDLKKEFNLLFDGDAYGECMHWWFAVAGEIYVNRDWCVPESWAYRPGLAPIDPDDYACNVLAQASDAALKRFGAVLDRYARALKHAGKDY